jgi:hypothetical protein
MVSQLRHKPDERRMVRDTRRDLPVCFTWKQVALEFFSLVSRLTEVRQRVVHVTSSRRLRQVKIEDRWVDVTDCVRPRGVASYYFS